MDIERNHSSGEGRALSREELEKRKQHNRRIIATFALFFTALFVVMTVSIVRRAMLQRKADFEHQSNSRYKLLEQTILRGTISTKDGVVVAKSSASDGENGKVVQTRSYPEGEEYCHVVGYADKGGLGLERFARYELMRSSLPLYKRFSYDLAGDPAKELYPGNSLIMTVNSKLQDAAYGAIEGRKGAVIATNVKTGAILAMASQPGFDPNEINEEWESLNSDRANAPLVNRVTQSLYAPGSTFKTVELVDIFTNHAGLEDTYSYTCNGKFTQDGQSIRCINGEVHGEVDLKESYAKSCNSSFANIGVNELDKETMRQTLKKLLFNASLPYEMDYEKSRISLADDISVHNLEQFAIGQGTTLMSPLHVHMITQAIANGGTLVEPHLIDSMQTAEGASLGAVGGGESVELMSSEVAGKVQEYMRDVVEEGTADSLSGLSYSVAGKTGSAEYQADGSSHGWFTCFAPADDPQIAVTVLIERGNTGAASAVPVARKVLDAYFAQ